jgi:hypothetical protein
MEDIGSDISLVENEFENLILTSKHFMTKRADEEISVMKNNIYVLNQKLDAVISRLKEEGDSKRFVVPRVLKKITHKLQSTIHLLEQIKNHRPFYREMDIPRMVDILLSDIRSLIYYHDKSTSLDKLESDLKTIDLLEEQHRRVLITFLMQDWANLKEVLILMRIGEIYRNIAEELVDIFLFIELLEDRP